MSFSLNSKAQTLSSHSLPLDSHSTLDSRLLHTCRRLVVRLVLSPAFQRLPAFPGLLVASHKSSSSALVISYFWVPAFIEDRGPSWGRHSSSFGVGSSQSPSRSGLLIIGSPYILWNILRSCEAMAKRIQGYCSR
ncbi:hypothetical protein S245_023135 [Arachis hypogaea]|nr:uncharacterized protein LOC112702390 [Arachis hypogaea]